MAQQQPKGGGTGKGAVVKPVVPPKGAPGKPAAAPQPKGGVKK
jgi:hypothetical protein